MGEHGADWGTVLRLSAVLVGLTLLVGPSVKVRGDDRAQRAGSDRVHRVTSTWVPYWSTGTAYRTVLRHADLFDYVSPFWYRTRGVSQIEPRPGAGDPRIVAGLRAKGIAVVPTVTLGLNTARWVAAMEPEAARRAHVSTLLRLADRYDGLDLDYETFTKTRDVRVGRLVLRTFTDVVRDLCTRLHARGKRCTVTVMARTRHAPVKFRGPNAAWVYDYPALLRVVDTMRVMAYHQHGPGGRPGPIAGTPWVRRIVQYAVAAADEANVPRSRIEIAVPAYGFDWPLPRGRGISRTSTQAEARRVKAGAARTWDPVAEEYSFRYVERGVRRVVHYADARSTRAKLAVVQRAGARYALWCPVGEDPAVWGSAFRPASTW